MNAADEMVETRPNGHAYALLAVGNGLSNPTFVAVRGIAVYVASAAYVTQHDPNLLVTRFWPPFSQSPRRDWTEHGHCMGQSVNLTLRPEAVRRTGSFVLSLFDRQSELASLVADAQAVAHGQSGLVVIEGAAGLGKTTLVEAFSDELGQVLPEACVLRARCDELERDFPFGVVRQLFEPLVAGWPKQEAEQMFSGPAEPATHVFSSVPCVGEANALGDAPRTVLHALFRLTLRIAATAPLVLVVDDLQKADLPSLRWLRYLVRKTTRSRVLVVLTVRSGEEDDSLRILDPGPQCRILRLERFTEQQVIDVLTASLPVSARPELLASCARLTGGNPMLVQALITSMSAGFDPVTSLSTSVVARFAGFVQSWLDTVPEQTRHFAAALAVLGSAHDGVTVGSLAGLSDGASVRAEDQLRELGLLAAGTELRWAHPLGRETVLGGLAPGHRKSLHLSAARHLFEEDADPERICAHLLNVPAPQEPWVAGTLLRAASDAAVRGAPDSVVRYLGRALEEQLSDGERLAAELDLGLAEAVQRPAQAWRRLTGVLERVTDPVVRATTAEVLADVLLREGRPADAEAVLSRVSTELAPVDRELALRLDAVRLAGQVLHGATEPLLRELEKAGTGETPGERAMLAVLAAVAAVAPGWDAKRVAALAERALARGVADLPPFTVQHAVRALAAAGSAANAARYCDEAIRHATRARAVLGLVTLIDARSRIALLAGDLDEARKLNEEAMVNLPLEHWGRLRHIPLATRMAVFTERGEIEAAGQLADDLLDLPAVVDVRLECAYVRAEQGWSRDALRLALDYAEARPREGQPAQLLAARLHAELGETEPAQRLATQAWEHANAWGTARAAGMALRTLGELASGQVAVDLLTRSAEVLDTTETRLEMAKSLLSLATAQARRGHASVARRTFKAARAEAEWCHAFGLADAARTGMMAAGARPRSRAVTGIEALTAGERRIADRAASGQSNRDIAAALHLTLRTVETHLSAVYRKLGIRSRTQLADVLRS